MAFLLLRPPPLRLSCRWWLLLWWLGLSPLSCPLSLITSLSLITLSSSSTIVVSWNTLLVGWTMLWSLTHQIWMQVGCEKGSFGWLSRMSLFAFFLKIRVISLMVAVLKCLLPSLNIVIQILYQMRSLPSYPFSIMFRDRMNRSSTISLALTVSS
jgi:hypothetical protein